MDCPAKGPGMDPWVLSTVFTAGSPVVSGLLTPVEWVAKYWAKRVSRKSRSPIESAAGVTSDSVLNAGAFPDPHPSSTNVAARARLAAPSATMTVRDSIRGFTRVFFKAAELPLMKCLLTRYPVEGCEGR